MERRDSLVGTSCTVTHGLEWGGLYTPKGRLYKNPLKHFTFLFYSIESPTFYSYFFMDYSDFPPVVSVYLLLVWDRGRKPSGREA